MDHGVDYPKVFGTVQVRRTGEQLLVQENPRMLPMRVAGNVAVIVLAGAGALYFFIYRGQDDGLLGGAYILLGLVLMFVAAIAVVAFIQLLVFVRFPITIDRAAKTVSRGNRIHLEGKLKAEIKRLSGGEAQSSFHVRVVEKKGKAMFLWRADSETEAKEMAEFINAYLGGSLADTEIGEDALDHVG